MNLSVELRKKNEHYTQEIISTFTDHCIDFITNDA